MSTRSSGKHTSPPRIAVLMPMFNTVGTLDEAVGSVVGQSLRDWELIVVDDGSTDGSLEKMAEWSAREPRIRVFTHTGGRHLGRPATRNKTVTEASADLVAFLDADDVLFPDTLEAYCEAFERHPSVGLVYGQAEILSDGRVTGAIGRGLPDVPVRAFSQLARFNIVDTSAAAARRQALGDAPFPADMVLAQDWACWLILARTWPLLFTTRILARYRWHEGGGTAAMRRAGGEPAYETMQGRFLHAQVAGSSGEERLAIRTGARYRACGAILRTLSALRRGRANEARHWLEAAARIAGSTASLVAALMLVPGERRRIGRGEDPPLTLVPWDGENDSGRGARRLAGGPGTGVR